MCFLSVLVLFVVLFWLTFKSVVFVFGVDLTIWDLILGAVFGLREGPPQRFLNIALPRGCHTGISHPARPASSMVHQRPTDGRKSKVSFRCAKRLPLLARQGAE
jgi:hypothetical protein